MQSSNYKYSISNQMGRIPKFSGLFVQCRKIAQIFSRTQQRNLYLYNVLLLGGEKGVLWTGVCTQACIYMCNHDISCMQIEVSKSTLWASVYRHT